VTIRDIKHKRNHPVSNIGTRAEHTAVCRRTHFYPRREPRLLS